MEARYLRVKNHTDYQHYDPLKRRPPWIKLHNDVLGGDDGFGRLSEQEQWQLVRIWLVASKSTSLTRDDKGRVVPVVADDEKSLRRSIMSLKPIPLAKFIREGWLIPVSESELLASTDASAADSPGASAPLVLEVQRVRGLEKDPKAVSSRTDERPLDEQIDTELKALKEAS